MKKVMVLAVLFILAGFLLTAAAQLPPPTAALHGTLAWQRASVCGVSDYVPAPVMANVYLTGKFIPTNGVLNGCHLDATGFYYSTSPACNYFFVQTYQVVCTLNNPGTPVH